MRLTLTKIEIKNTYSFADFTFEFTEGIHKVTGVNGAGKSSLFYAIIQCLYNTNPKITRSEAGIATVNNIVTGEPYSIKLSFTLGNNFYSVLNCKKQGIIQIFENDVDISQKRIADNLKLIQKIIGLDYDSFTEQLYQSSRSSLDILENNTDGKRKAYLNKILEFDELDSYLELVKQERKATLTEISLAQVDITHAKTKVHDIETLIEKAREDYKEQIGTTEQEAEITILQLQLKVLKGNLEDVVYQSSNTTNELGNLRTRIEKANNYQKLLNEFDIATSELDKVKQDILEDLDSTKAQQLYLKRQQGTLASDKTHKILQINSLKKTLQELEQYAKDKDQFDKIPKGDSSAKERLNAIIIEGKDTANKISEKEARLLELNASKTHCPTCHQKITDDASLAKIEEAKASISAEIAELTLNKKAIRAVYEEVSLEVEIVKKYEAEATKFASKYKTLAIVPPESIQAEIQQIEQELQGIAERQVAVEFQLKDMEATLLRHEHASKAFSRVTVIEAKMSEYPFVESVAYVQELIGLAEVCENTLNTTKLRLRTQEKALELEIKTKTSTLQSIKIANAEAKKTETLLIQYQESFNKAKSVLDTLENDLHNDLEVKLLRLQLWEKVLGNKGCRVEKMKHFIIQFNQYMRAFSKLMDDYKIDCQIYLTEDNSFEFRFTDGNKTLPYSCWSDGEKTRIRMIVLFALHELFGAYKGTFLNVLCLDEVFGTLDTEGKYSLFSILSSLKGKGKAIYTIAHDDLVNDSIYNESYHFYKWEGGTKVKLL